MFCTASPVTHNSVVAKIRTFDLSTDVLLCKDFPVLSYAPCHGSVWRSEGIALRILNFSCIYK